MGILQTSSRKGDPVHRGGRHSVPVAESSLVHQPEGHAGFSFYRPCCLGGSISGRVTHPCVDLTPACLILLKVTHADVSK